VRAIRHMTIADIYIRRTVYINLKNIPPREPRGIEIGPRHVSAIKIPLLLDTPLRIKFVRLAAGQQPNFFYVKIKMC
jgi:hypothetical protein